MANEETMKKNIITILYHSIVVVASAGIALSLPITVKYIMQKTLQYWSLIENDKLFLVSTEIAAAIFLILAVNFAVKSRKINALARMAKTAGMAAVAPARSFLEKRQIKKLKESHGHGRSIMLMGSTGFTTFSDPAGDLHQVLRDCREAKIMLLDPLKEGVTARAKSLAGPDVTPENLREQLIRSIDFLKELKAQQKKIRLKLYPEAPHLKLAILGDYLFLQHYCLGKYVKEMPEYVFKHDTKGGLFNLFYQVFIDRWLDASMPEYDLDTDELIYRDAAGNELLRRAFNDVVMQS
jgi:hypothetical protein